MDDSVYNKFAPQLIGHGYFPLPIAPGSKAPHRYVPSKKEFELFVGWNERPDPIITPQPGAGVGVRLGKGVVALDYDNEEAALRVSEAMGAARSTRLALRRGRNFIARAAALRRRTLLTSTAS
jgi:Bifunctional DNA primase/polymerase, N-terminal